ncbi:hypothetical protein HQN85_06680 [Pedobacter boryungensis]|uniref:Adhesin domain-containing protein n=2 Tax=Pedobacter boryungensis TaxID=869962 RepID=A0ABX2DDN9_9SPHI|nr:hypothetical protein [Pedobacter boryungensis]
MLLLAIQVNAQQQPEVTVNINANPTVSVSTSSNRSYAVNTNVQVHPEVNVTTSTNIQDQADGPMKAKTFSKTFSVDKSDKINLSNRYGEMVIKVWDRNEIKVDVDIKAYSTSDNDAQKLLDDVSIIATKTGDLVTYKTSMGEKNGNWGKSIRNGKVLWRKEVKVNYIVYMPANNALTLSNMYGNVNMGNLSAALYAKVQYGNFTAGNLSSNNNYISVQYGNANIQELNKAVVKQQYGKGLTIGTVETLDLDVQYAGANITNIKGNAVVKQQYGSGLIIGAVDNLELDAQYTNVNVTTINGNASIKQQYNKLAIGSVGKLKLDAQYTGATIGSLKGDGYFDMEYNNLNIGNISSGCKILTIKSEYADVNLGFANGYNANFEVSKTYGSFKYGADVTSKMVSSDDETKKYSGKIGNGGVADVKINAEYGAVTFK